MDALSQKILHALYLSFQLRDAAKGAGITWVAGRMLFFKAAIYTAFKVIHTHHSLSSWQ
jgi:hypothetical protein